MVAESIVHEVASSRGELNNFQVEEFATAATVRIRSSIDPISLQAKPIRKNTFKACQRLGWLVSDVFAVLANTGSEGAALRAREAIPLTQSSLRSRSSRGRRRPGVRCNARRRTGIGGV